MCEELNRRHVTDDNDSLRRNGHCTPPRRTVPQLARSNVDRGFLVSSLSADLGGRKSNVVVVSASLSSSMSRAFRLAHLFVGSVCLSVRKVYCGKTADWIRMPFRMVNEVCRGMGVLDGVVIVKGKRQFFLGGDLWRPIITNGTLLHSCESDALFSSYFEDLLLLFDCRQAARAAGPERLLLHQSRLSDRRQHERQRGDGHGRSQ